MAVRRHIGGWITTVLVVADDAREAFGWTAEEPSKRRQDARRTGRLAPTVEEAQAYADAWLTSQGHSCVDLECRLWGETSGTERADASHLRWVACASCEEFHPLDEIRWINSSSLVSHDGEGRWHVDVAETDPRDPDAAPHCLHCADRVLGNAGHGT